MLSDNTLVDSVSWTLQIFITDLNIEKFLLVRGDIHVGGVMHKLVNDIDIQHDWSDHAFWSPKKNIWLTHTKSTLDQYGITADYFLHFTPMHKMLRIQLPDLRYIECKVNFSIKTFNAVFQLCKELGIEHPEELSFRKVLEQEDLKYNYSEHPIRKQRISAPVDTNTFGISPNTSITENCFEQLYGQTLSSPMKKGLLDSTASNPKSISNVRQGNRSTFNSFNGLGGNSFNSFGENVEHIFSVSPAPTDEALCTLLHPRSLVERARINVSWLDSSLSVMEQGVQEYSTLLLRFKFYMFYDLSGPVRIHQLYEQARWQLLNEEVDCTEEEMLMFAALQLQVKLQETNPQSDSSDKSRDDDIDAALNNLQLTLEGNSSEINSTDIIQIPELSGYLKFLRPNRFTFKRLKRYWFVCRDLQFLLFKSPDHIEDGPSHHINLRGCEPSPEVHIAHGHYGIKLEVPDQDEMSEVRIVCEREEQYAKLLAAFRLASKGKTLADRNYENEIKSIQAFLAMQHPAPSPTISPADLKINPEEFVAKRFLKRSKTKLIQRILEAHANVTSLSLMEAKMNFIKAWQSLPDYGITLFVVRFQDHKKEELLGIAFNRLMCIDLHSGDLIKTWRFSNIMAWNVNWDKKMMMVQFEENTKAINFFCLSADCKVVHEFIGGYIFLSMRNKDASQNLDEEMFHKLTTGWV